MKSPARESLAVRTCGSHQRRYDDVHRILDVRRGGSCNAARMDSIAPRACQGPEIAGSPGPRGRCTKAWTAACSALSVQLDALRVSVVLPLTKPSSYAACGARLTSVPVGFHQTNGRRRYLTFA